MNSRDSNNRNYQHVQSLAAGLAHRDIEIGDVCENCSHIATEECAENQECSECTHNPNSAMNWLDGALDINYLVNSDLSFKGARVLVAFGGPNIWVDFTTSTIELNWWGESASCSFVDEIGVLDLLEDLYICGRD